DLLPPEAQQEIAAAQNALERLEKLSILLQRELQKAETMATLAEGQIYKSAVQRLTDDAAFVTIDGIECLLPLAEMSWQPIRHPSAVLTVGDEIRVMVLQVDRDQGRVTVGRRQLLPDEGTQAA